MRQYLYALIFYFRLGPARQSFAEKFTSSVYRCYYTINVRPIFTTKTAFNSIDKNKLPIFKHCR